MKTRGNIKGLVLLFVLDARLLTMHRPTEGKVCKYHSRKHLTAYNVKTGRGLRPVCRSKTLYRPLPEGGTSRNSIISAKSMEFLRCRGGSRPADRVEPTRRRSIRRVDGK